MFYCEKCGKEWPNNYCPNCSRTIERSEIEPIPLEKKTINKNVFYIKKKYEYKKKYEDLQRESGLKNMLYGALWCIGGIIVTVVSYAYGGGRTYIIAWGVIIFGAIKFIRGVVQEVLS